MVTSSETTTTDYLAGFQYHNGSLKHFPHAEGYVNVVDRKFKYVYNYTDHLGNIRLSYSKDPANNVLKIIEENHYYPFGLKHTAYNTNEKKYIKDEVLDKLILTLFPKFAGDGSYNYKYNGKEYQDELGLNMYDYGARNYDPAIGRWMNIDPLAEMQPDKTPYHFCSNNPVNRIDPDGKWDIEVHAYNNRSKNGYAVMIMRDNSGNEVYRTVVKTVGFGGRKRNVSMSDTPQGNYKILGWRKTGSGTRYNTTTYGPNDLLALDYQGGEGGSRNGMHVHGGRQEGKYKNRKDLMVTGGCFRINDNDIKEIQNIATNLQNSNPDEKPGILKLTDDLINPVDYNNERHNAGNSQFSQNTTTTQSNKMTLQEELDWINSVRAFDPKYVQKRTQEIRNEMRKQDNN